MGKSNGGAARSRRARRPWVRWTDDRLLDLRFCDLGVTVEGTWLEGPIAQLYDELDSAGLRVRPHFWLSTEWFSPDGVPGVAIPFYLAHPRLMKLERRHALEVEGGTWRECMKVLRHETGHAVQHAYRLHRRKKSQALFGKSSEPYPDFYRPNPASKRFVVNLDLWYAQSHPDEDFAETFAVWLSPRSQWRKRYAGWPALRKLEWVDQTMKELGGQSPLVKSRECPDALPGIRQTLRSYYEAKAARYAPENPTNYDAKLAALFRGKGDSGEPAARFVRRNRSAMRKALLRWVPDAEYAFDTLILEIIDRCREMKLRATGPRARLQGDLLLLVTALSLRYLYRSREWHPL